MAILLYSPIMFGQTQQI